MFLSDNINAGLDSAISKVDILNNGLKGVYQAVKDSIDPRKIMSDADAINRAASKVARETLGRGREMSNMLTETFAKARKNTLEFGFGLEKNIELFSAINNELRTTRLLTSEQLTDMNALAMSVGLTSKEMADFVKNFDMLGKGTDDAIGAIARLQTEARSYGLNVAQFMRTVGENMKFLASYNFKGGIDGLSKMVAQAQSLRIDMGKTVSFAEDLMDPSRAIEVAAGFQMLGGAVGALGDPFQLLHMAQTDMAGLQNSLVDMSAAAVTFNEKTGEFDIPVTEMYRLREVTKLTGIGYQELAEMAMNSAKKTKKLEFLEGLSNIPEDQKELVANLGEIKGGRLKISIGDELIDAAELSNDQLEKLGKFQTDLNKTDEQLRAEAVTIARESQGLLEKIESKIAQTTAIPETNIITSGAFQTQVEKIAGSITNVVDAFNEKIEATDFSKTIGTLYDRIIPTQTKDDIEKYLDIVFKGMEKFAENIKEFNISDITFDGGIITINSSGGVVVNHNVTQSDRQGNGSGVTQSNRNPTKTKDLVVTSQGESFQTAVDDYIFAISEQNLGNLTDTISNLSMIGQMTNNNQPIAVSQTPVNDSFAIYEQNLGNLTDTISKLSTVGQMTNNNQPMAVNISGDINLKLEGIPVNSEISKETIANLIRNNPQAISVINKQLNNTLNTYGGYV
jgi:hypothetical protein